MIIKKQQHVFGMKDQDFPLLEKSKKPCQIIWNHVQTEVRTDDSLDSKTLLLINENLVAMRDSNSRIEEKLGKIDIKLNQTTLDTELHQTSIVKLIEHVHLLIHHIIWSVTSAINPALLNFTSSLQSVFDKLAELKSNLLTNYEIRYRFSINYISALNLMYGARSLTRPRPARFRESARTAPLNNSYPSNALLPTEYRMQPISLREYTWRRTWPHALTNGIAVLMLILTLAVVILE
ncbi:unnamed protein product, partial [Rotaria magnacalcarata]